MKRVLRFLVDYWYLPLIVIGAVLGFVLASRRKDGDAPTVSPIDLVAKEVQAIQAKAEARDLAEQLGAEQAKAHVLEKYQAEHAALDAQQREQAKSLEQDPEALAKFLVKSRT